MYLDGERRRTAGEDRGAIGAGWFLDGGEREENQRLNRLLKDDFYTFEHLSGRAHPGAENGRVSGRLMMGVVDGVLDRLGVDHSAEEQKAEGQRDGQGAMYAPAREHQG